MVGNETTPDGFEIRHFSFERVPKVTSNRWQCTGAEGLTEQFFMYCPRVLDTPEMRSAILKYTENVIRDVARDFAKGAERGIEQVSELLRDPTFYETKKAERKRYLDEMKRQREQQEAERREKQLCPTQEQVVEELSKIERWLADHRRDIERLEASREQLLAYKPKNVRLMPAKKT